MSTHEPPLSPEPPPASDLDAIACALRATWHSVVRHVEFTGRLEGVGRQQYWVLARLADGPRRMTDLAECADVSQASLTGIVDRLEERDLVKRDRSADDRRVVTVELTDAGRDALAFMHKQFVDRLETMLAPLSADERRTLLDLLLKISRPKGT